MTGTSSARACVPRDQNNEIRSLGVDVSHALAERFADYVATHERYDAMSKRDVAIAVVELILSDIGAAQEVLDTIGVRVDLYTFDRKPHA